MKTVWARLSQPAILPCDLSPADGEEAAANLLLEWRRNGSLIFNAFGQEPGFSSAEYQGRLGRAGNLGMTIHSVKADDQDLYRCSVTRFAKSTNGGEKEHGKLMRLVVHSHPRITDPADGEEFFVRPNGTANLECQAEGIPTPSVRWKRKMESGRLTTVQEGPSLRVDKFTEEMEGEYICEADNFEGRATAVLRLRTRRPLRIDRQNASLVNKTAVEGASVFWHCAVEEPGGWRQNQQPQVLIRWSRDEQPISGSAVGLRAHLKDGEFGILRLRREDSGPYACEASSSREADGFFEHDRVVVQLDVQYKPEISTAKTRRFHTLVSGARAELDCFVQANPVPTIVKWTKNGREMHGHQEQLVGDGSLLLSRVPIGAASLPADAGIYTCEAENSVGASAAFEIHVVVADGPKFTKMPAPVYRVNAGHRLEVPCEGFAEVPLRKLWTKNGEPFEVADSKFVLESASHDHHGVYQCILVNSVVSVFKEFQIFVEETWPQCAAQVRVECLGPRAGFSLSWVPGYPGGNVTQLFRIFYRKSQNNMDKEEKENEQQGWMATDFTNHAGLRLEGLEEFGEYEMKLEAGNKFGSVNCSLPARHHTCSKLSTPANFHLDWMDGEAQRRPILLWDRVAEAGKYKVKYRRNGRRGGDNAFRELAELTGTQFPLPLQRLNLNESGAASGGAEFVVQAVRAPFLSSEPTEAILFPPAGNAQNSVALAFGLVATGGLISALFFVLLLIFVKKHSKGRRNIFVEKAETQQQQQGNCHVVLNGIEKHHQHLQHGFSPNSHNNSSHFPSSSTLTSFQQLQLQQQQHYSRFGRHPVAITRKLFPDNYICTKLAQFDEEEEEVEGEMMVEGEEEEAARRQSFEQYGQFPSCENGSFLLGNGSSVSANFTAEMQSEPANWHAECHRGCGQENGGIASKSASYMEMRTAAASEERRSAVDEMLREKYIFDQTETLDRMDELRIEQLRRELMGKYGNDNDNVV